MSGAVAGERRMLPLMVGAIGVVYGDIGTSPLYALREVFGGHHPLTLTPANVLGVLSLMFWSLVVIVTLKYVVVIMRADNNGEGGILALTGAGRCAARAAQAASAGGSWRSRASSARRCSTATA